MYQNKIWLIVAFNTQIIGNKGSSPLTDFATLLATLMQSRRSFEYETLGYIVKKLVWIYSGVLTNGCQY